MTAPPSRAMAGGQTLIDAMNTSNPPTLAERNAHRRAVLQQYIDRINACDVAGVVALYADDATIEDPVGGPTVQGRAAIEAFYGQVVPMRLTLRLAAPVRGSHGNAAAMAFEVDAPLPTGGVQTVRVIDVMTFNDQGLITSMKAYWAPDDQFVS